MLAQAAPQVVAHRHVRHIERGRDSPRGPAGHRKLHYSVAAPLAVIDLPAAVRRQVGIRVARGAGGLSHAGSAYP